MQKRHMLFHSRYLCHTHTQIAVDVLRFVRILLNVCLILVGQNNGIILYVNYTCI